MIFNRTISVIGGDSRLIYAAEHLAGFNNDVQLFGCDHGKIPDSIKTNQSLDKAFSNEIIILPLPVSKNGKILNSPLSTREITLNELTELITERNIIFLGMGQPCFKKQIEAKTPFVCDYFNIESFTYKNARLTAEGILGIILDKLPVSVYRLPVAVTGYGRIGELLTQMLLSLGAKVTVFSRNEKQRIKANLSGADSFEIEKITDNISNFDCVINTVPSIVIDEESIIKSKTECLFIETASSPYGINFDSCMKNRRQLIKAFSLPGKTAPKTAGIIIAETINDYFREVK